VERKKALITAAIVSGAVFAASAAIGLNVGLLDSGADENPVGDLQADDLVSAESPAATSTSAAAPVTVVVDEYVTQPGPTGAPSAPAGGTGDVLPSGTSGDPSSASSDDDPGYRLAPPNDPAPSYHDDDDDHDDQDEHDGEHEDDEDEHEEEHEEYEGHDDDD
jgi:hypothetical protein